ncbi:unnamed protein product [Mesocestoides corti]|uniref:Uncharacterized protein n=1 Tax=Mesocestoides corti TaxID=53468 RepID=A0A0R3UAK6_MESCO|nr:unnamed protein product [Mesocestoides corti]
MEFFSTSAGQANHTSVDLVLILNISTSPHETPFSRMKHRPPVSVDYDEEDEGIHSACTSSPLAGLTHATYRVTAHGNGSVEFAADQDERFKCVKLINTSGDVWNSDSGASHDPPTDIVMKNQSFKIGSNITFTLIDNDGVEQANCQIVQERVRAAGSHLRSQSSSTDENISKGAETPLNQTTPPIHI